MNWLQLCCCLVSKFIDTVKCYPSWRASSRPARILPASLPSHDVVETSQYSAAAAAAVDRSFCPRHSPSVLSLSATAYVRRRNSRLAAVIQYTKASGVYAEAPAKQNICSSRGYLLVPCLIKITCVYVTRVSYLSSGYDGKSTECRGPRSKPFKAIGQ